MIRSLVALAFLASIQAEETLQVYKAGVLHTFVKSDELTDAFIQTFDGWEKETFEIFEQVKDPQSIAIDLGAWIGTTSIWLSNHFYHVIAVEADKESLERLRKNLAASECINVSVCEQPISNEVQEVLFGPIKESLNESMSCIKTKGDNLSDYFVESITLKKLLLEYLYSDKGLYSHRIGFIKCDIEGGEEDILEDLLQFASEHKCKLYISFHIEWWKSKRLYDFESLFNLFTINCPTSDLYGYLQQYPFASLLFEPLETFSELRFSRF